MPPHHVEVSKVVEIIDSILHVEEYYLDSPSKPRSDLRNFPGFLDAFFASFVANHRLPQRRFQRRFLRILHSCRCACLFSLPAIFRPNSAASSAGRFETAIGSRVEGRFIDVCSVGGGEKAVAGEWDFGGFFGVAVRAML